MEQREGKANEGKDGREGEREVKANEGKDVGEGRESK